MNNYFITGTGTGVGKTIVASILTEALNADYWKPVQCGNLENTDKQIVRGLVSNSKSVFHKETFLLKTPVSPHLAASIEGVEINLNNIEIPYASNNIVIEGAGGLMVPINTKGDLMLDLIKKLRTDIILVSQNYLGSINHTLLTVSALNVANIKIAGIVFNGDENSETEKYILNYTSLPCLGKIRKEESLNKEIIIKYAKSFNINLLN